MADGVRDCYIGGMATQAKIPADDEDELLIMIEAALQHDDGAAAQSHLAAGRPIYYLEPATPPDAVIKEYPGGRRTLVSFDRAGKETLVSELA